MRWNHLGSAGTRAAFLCFAFALAACNSPGSSGGEQPDASTDIEDTGGDTNPDVAPDADPDVAPDADPDADPDVDPVECMFTGNECSGDRIIACDEGLEVTVSTCAGTCDDSGVEPTCICVTGSDCGEGEVCDSAGDCVGALDCTDGATFCDDNVVTLCDDQRFLVPIETCAGSCVEEGDTALCLCTDNSHCADDELCNIDGDCVPAPDCINGEILCAEVNGEDGVYECVDGALQLVDACSFSCDDSGAEARCLCSDDDDCDTGEVCNGDSLCEVPAECSGEESRCVNDTLERCVDGNFVVETTCPGICDDSGAEATCLCTASDQCALSEFCDANGDCISDLCDAGTARCEDDVAYRCRADGSGEATEDCSPLSCTGLGRCACTDSTQCGPDAFCDTFSGDCVPNACTPDEEFCLNGAIQLCNSEGTGSTVIETCTAGCADISGAAICSCASNADCANTEFCDNGTCEADICTPGSALCVGGDVQICATDGGSLQVEDCGALSCVNGECLCTQNDQCDTGEFCDNAGVCQPQVCTPNEATCSGNFVAQCNADGSRESLVEECSEACVDGACTCSSDDACNAGESCINNACVCESGVTCGEDDFCCPGGTLCELDQICSGGTCQETALCVQPCPSGQQCGAFGQICCEGATPVCGPTNTCEPDCGEQAACGGTCCDAGDVCIFGECTTPGLSCSTWQDCDFGEYCEPLLGECLPNDFPVECRQPGQFDAFRPETLWNWTGVTVGGRLYQNVVTVPVVGDLDQDGFPEVVIKAYDQSNKGVIVAIDGRDGTTSYVNGSILTNRDGNLALGNLDADPYLEIVVIIDKGIGVIDDPVNCPDPDVDPDGCYLWTYASGTINGGLTAGAPGIADFNNDGQAEVYAGSVVLDGATGALIGDAGSQSAAAGQFSGQFIPAAADVDDDGELELLTGDCAWDVDVDGAALTQLWCNTTFSQGFPGVADFDNDGNPEVAVVASGRVYILNGQTGATLHDIILPNGGHGGAPNIADFDNDGRPELGTAGKGCYSVFDLDCLGSSSADQPGCTRPEFPPCLPGNCPIRVCPALPNGTGNGVLWSIESIDNTSSSTGSSVFDFQGDGVAEVLYNDECRMLALDGGTGLPFTGFPNPTRTASGYPVVADVSGNGRSELVFGSTTDTSNNCSSLVADSPNLFPECDDTVDPPAYCNGDTIGVFAWTDPNDTWVRTRPVWNQHAYQITNVEDSGAIPAFELPSWLLFNMFRANEQGEVPLNAPNPAVTSFSASLQSCPVVTFRVGVSNNGTAGIPAGMPVLLYRLDEGVGTPIGSSSTSEALFPGGTTVVEFDITLAEGEVFMSLDYAVELNVEGDVILSLDCDYGDNVATLENISCIPENPGDTN